MEIWKQYKDTYYDVSNMGNVRSNSRGKVCNMKLQLNKKGYPVINMFHKKQLIHRMVAETFIPLIDNKQCVNHKNLIKTDNRVENLEWCNVYENNQHAQDNGVGQIAKPCTVIDCNNEILGEFPSWSKAYGAFKKSKSKFIIIKNKDFTSENRLSAIHKKTNREYKRKVRPINRTLNDDAVNLIKELMTRDGFYLKRVGDIFGIEGSVVKKIIEGKIYKDYSDLPFPKYYLEMSSPID